MTRPDDQAASPKQRRLETADAPLVLVTGAESTGTRMMRRMLHQAGANAVHAVMPMALNGRVNWHRRCETPAVAAVVMFRDLHATVESQVAARHAPDAETALFQIRKGYREIFHQLTCPWFPVTYESLANPQALDALCALLGLPGRPREAWRDENAKYYAGGPSGR